ncbi:DUF1127 domain-containing protein [Erwiniaceae bacterium BAC15a-03b]|uniref:DUF1127 domain-containing protein n=1 Tax=Winslowiella arboricola TaxID=2978220 RepID=A0A9J6PPH1_9GAMM|nr:DUF1127 domain-containing protein [Winslowiella arboricola]MCU5771593.1 DUF1127 domain-containing protein [Winslowiella arboricola]MCU5775935.1 DUF1127 domain-containing protein [Winslowiella arboricola]
MEYQENRTGQLFAGIRFRMQLILLYRRWQAWRLRQQTRNILSGLSDTQLRDIGLTSEDVDRYK